MNEWDIWKKKIKKSGFEDIPAQERCINLEHEPPMFLYIPPGKQYRHVCPGCGKERVLRPPFVSMSSR